MPLIAAALTCAIVVVDASAAAADDGGAEVITLDELIAAAVRRSPNLARTRAAVAVARGNQRAARGRDDWQLRLGATT